MCHILQDLPLNEQWRHEYNGSNKLHIKPLKPEDLDLGEDERLLSAGLISAK